MKKSWAVMRRDLIKLSRNPLTIVTSVMLPIIYLIIFGNSFHPVAVDRSTRWLSDSSWVRMVRGKTSCCDSVNPPW